MSFPRYPEYKDSGVEWLGEVPAHWNVSPFKWLIDANDGGAWGDEPLGNNDTYVLRSTDQTVDGFWKISDPALRHLSPKERDSTLLKPGDLVITKSSGSNRHIGKTTLVDEEIAAKKFSFGNFMQRIRTKRCFKPKLAWYLMNNPLARLQLDVLSNTTTGLANLNGTLIGEIFIAVPPEEEQGSLLSFLDHETARIDALVAEQQRLIELLKEKRQAVISHAVTKGLNPDVPMKDSGVEWLGEVPAHWDVRKASFIGRLFGSDNVPEDMVSNEGDTPYLKVGSLSTESLEVADWGWYVDPSISGAYRACDHYVVFPKRGAAIFLNKVNVVSCSALIDPNLMGWEIEGEHSTWYFAYSLKSRKLDELADVSTVPQINNKHIGPERFPVPPIEEQEQIVSYLKQRLGSIDELVATAESGVKLLRERRSAIISAAVTGKIDVRGCQPPPGSFSPTETNTTEQA